MAEEKLAAENAFIMGNRLNLVSFARDHAEKAGRGVVLAHQPAPGAFSAEVRYLSLEELAAFNLIGPGGPAHQQNLTAALEQYNPAEQLVLLFLYQKDATVYLLGFDDLLYPDLVDEDDPA